MSGKKYGPRPVNDRMDLIDLFSSMGNINAITEFALDAANGDGKGL